MFKIVFSQANLELWPTVALIIFFSIMTGVCLWVCRPHSSQFYKKISLLPFDSTENKGAQQ